VARTTGTEAQIFLQARSFKASTMRHLLVFCLLCSGLVFAAPPKPPRVLLLWDVKNEQTAALATSLRTSGVEVVYSETDGPGFNGDNPPLAGFDVVVHLNGTTWQRDMTVSGQKALVHFVEAGGGYVHHEWNAYQLSVGQLAALRPLVLFDRSSGYGPGDITVTKVEAKGQQHPVIWEIPRTFKMNGACNVGKVHAFEKFPAVSAFTMAATGTA
jgi:hypothetical protein